jgi:hypothetical protein
MTKIPLSISPNYVNWSWWQALREVMQNAIDSHDCGMPMSYSYDEKSGHLMVKNIGAELGRETLVLGVSSKKNIASQRGEFGEGYKLALATFVRLGSNVVIMNGREVWTPELSHSNVFNTEILSINIAHAETASPLTFHIDKVPAEEWARAKARLLFLNAKYPECIVSAGGRILTDKRYAGMLFVKGIFIANLPDKYNYGYDLDSVTLDRDRQAPDAYSLRIAVSTLLKRAVESRAIPANALLEILMVEGGESLCFESDWSAASAFHTMISDAFDLKYGENCVAVASFEESLRAADFAMNGIVLNQQLLRIIRRVKSPLDALISSKILSVEKTYSAHELSAVETANLKWAIALATRVEPFDLAKLSIVDFFGNKLWGKFDRNTHNTFLARSILSNKTALIGTLIHELCHKYGNDGEQSHRNAVEDRLSKLIVESCVS